MKSGLQKVTGTKWLCAIFVPTFLVGAAQAEDYPYAGIFAASQDPKNCVFGFTIVHPNGQYDGYSLDRKRWLENHEISYANIYSGACEIGLSAGQKASEECSQTNYVFSPDSPYSYGQVTDFSDPFLLHVEAFATLAEAEKYLNDGIKPEGTTGFDLARCNEITEENVQAFLEPNGQAIDRDLYDKYLDPIEMDRNLKKYENMVPEIISLLK